MYSDNGWRTTQAHTSCDLCGSSDAVTERVNVDNDVTVRNCFSCGGTYKVDTDDKESHTSPSTSGTEQQVLAEKHSKNKNVNNLSSYPIRSLPDRCISQQTSEYYGVRVKLDPMDGSSITSKLFPYYKKNKLVSFKEKVLDENSATINTYAHGDIKRTGFFGQHKVSSKGKTLYITEGEEDCLAVYQTLKKHSNFDWFPAVVSISTGAGKQVMKNFTMYILLVIG